MSVFVCFAVSIKHESQPDEGLACVSRTLGDFMSWRLPTLPGLNLVPSAQRDFTALFGMGRGVSPALFPPFALQFLYFGRADVFRRTYKMLPF